MRFALIYALLPLLSLLELQCQRVCNITDMFLGAWKFKPQNVKTSVCCTSYVSYSTPFYQNYTDYVKYCRHRLGYSPANHCACDLRDNTLMTPSKREMWEWSPNANCRLLSFTGQAFCDYLAKRKILLIGDSTMGQIMNTFVSMFGLHPLCLDQIMYGYMAKMNFRNVTLNGIFERFTSADIVIINIGPWYHDVAEFNRDMISLVENIERVRKNTTLGFVNATFLWKTISVPHFNCYSYKEPVTAPLTYSPNISDPYRWTRFPYYDKIAVEYMRKHNIDIIDMYPLMLRPDAHVNYFFERPQYEDCLHYCQPGPLNVFVLMILHYLYHTRPTHVV